MIQTRPRLDYHRDHPLRSGPDPDSTTTEIIRIFNEHYRRRPGGLRVSWGVLCATYRAYGLTAGRVACGRSDPGSRALPLRGR